MKHKSSADRPRELDMADDELAAIRAARLKELQQQSVQGYSLAVHLLISSEVVLAVPVKMQPRRGNRPSIRDSDLQTTGGRGEAYDRTLFTWVNELTH
jgi:hypothetical protein